MIEEHSGSTRIPPPWYYWMFGQACFLDRQYERAIVTLRHESTYRTESRRTLAASLALLGRTSEAAGSPIVYGNQPCIQNQPKD